MPEAGLVARMNLDVYDSMPASPSGILEHQWEKTVASATLFLRVSLFSSMALYVVMVAGYLCRIFAGLGLGIMEYLA